MIPGMNPHQIKVAMKKLGIQQEEIPAVEVIIRLEDKEIVIKNPQVSKVNMMGQQTYQIIGAEEERSLDTKPEINEEDVETVMAQAGVSHDKALEAIENARGDLAQAIIDLKD